MDEYIQIKPMKLNPEVAQHQSNRLLNLRNNRDQEQVDTVLERITQASADGTNLFPIVLDAVRLNATLGEIIQAMKNVFGAYSAPGGF